MREKTGSLKVVFGEYLMPLVVGAVVIFGILLKAGTLTSGYHFLDDHEVIRFEYSIQNGADIFEMMTNAIKNDMWWRFRPFYWVERIAGTAVFGSDMYGWNVYTAVKGAISFALLVMFAQNLKYKKYICYLFAAIIMIGPQFTPWYRSANQENTGLLLSALVLWMISQQRNIGKIPRWIWNLLICLITILCGLVKESFTLFMPACLALKFWLDYTETGFGVKKCIGSAWYVYGIVLGAFINHVWWIVCKVGVDNVSYAGFQEGVSLSRYFYGIRDSLLVYMKWYTLMGALFAVTWIMCYQLFEKERMKEYLGGILIGGYVVAVQLVAHAKSLMWERYMIPYMIGYAFIFVLVGYRFYEKDKMRRRIYGALILLLLVLEFPAAYRKAQEYAADGKAIQTMLTYVVENTEENDIIVGAFSDGELNIATSSWLEVNDRTGEYIYSWENGDLNDKIQLAESNSKDIDFVDAEIALCYGGQADQVMELMGAKETLQASYFGNYCVVSRQIMQ